MRLLSKLFLVLSIVIAIVLWVNVSDSTAQTGESDPTPLPYCEYYSLTVATANVRSCADSQCGVVTQLSGIGTSVCTRGAADNAGWLQVDLAPDDPASPIYFISRNVLRAGIGSANDPLCQSWYVAEDLSATVYECASSTCAIVGTLSADEWTCSQEFSSQYPGWLYIQQSDQEITGWVQSGVMVRGRDTRVASGTPAATAIRRTNTPGTPTITPPAGTITLSGAIPACQIYHVKAERSAARVCAGANCRSAKTLTQNEQLCIRGISTNPRWFIADLDPDDDNSPLYAVDSADIAPGTAEDSALQRCEAFEVSSSQNINLRECPSETCPILATLTPDSWVCVTDYERDWVYAYVPEDGLFAWISDRTVRSMGIDGTPTPIGTPAEGIDSTAIAQVENSPTPSPSLAPTLSPTIPVIGGTAEVISSPTTSPTASPSVEASTIEAPLTCLPYRVLVAAANVRSAPSTSSSTVAQLPRATTVCVLRPVPLLENEWFEIDLDPSNPDNALTFMAQELLEPDPEAALAATAQASSTPELDINGTPLPTSTLSTNTPTPIFTAVPTAGPSGDLLAQEITLAGLNVRSMELRSPVGSNSFRFRLPADWFPDGTNILYLHVNYTEIESTLNLETGGLVSFLDVQLNNQAVASVALNRNTTGEQTLVIPLRTDLLADTSRRDHSIQMTLRAEDHCLANSESRLYIRNDLSFIHFEFREGVPALDLALYPRPLFNEGFVNVAETALVVLPPNASNNDHQAAAGIVAGLGLLTNDDLQVSVANYDQLSAEQLLNSNILLVGQIGQHPFIDDLYARGLLPSQLAADGTLSAGDTLIDPTDGIVQVITHPDNPKQGIVVVTSQTAEGLRKGAQALSGPQSLYGLGGPIAIIEDTRPVQRPPAGVTLGSQISFADLGFTELSMNGIGSQSTEIEFSLPYNQVLADGAYVDLLYTSSEIIQNGKATISLSMNYNTPLASTYITGQPDGGLEVGPSRMRAWIPPSAVIPGERNYLVIQLDVAGDWECNYPNPDIAWFTVLNSSFLHLPTRFVTPNDFRPLVAWFPSPFNSQPDLSDVWISLPNNPSAAEIQQGYDVIKRLGSASFGGEGFRPYIHVGELPADTDLAAYNFIVIGRNTSNSFLADLNSNLPQPFIADTDQLQQVLDDVSYRFPSNYEIGVLQTLESPWSPNRMIMVITGTGARGQQYAVTTLLSGRYGRDELLGDVVFVSENSAISVVDTRTIEDTLEIVTAAAELPTQAALQAMSTPTANAAFTVTPGPSPTLFPSNTPPATSTGTPLFTETPGTMTVTPFPTILPLSPEQLQPEVVSQPKWLNFLAIATTAILGIVALAVVIGFWRGRQRAL